MFRRFNSSPVLFAQTLEIKNRQRFRRFKSITKKMSNLLSDRSVLTLRSSLELSVERVGEVFDVQNCHRFLLNSSIMEELSANCKGRCWRQQTSARVCGHIVPASAESFLSPFPKRRPRHHTTLELYPPAMDEFPDS